jgi:glycosyltransferase involved in cell wall biosynthesis
MRIAVDARELAGHATGVGRYLQRLLQQWALDRVPHAFSLYTPSAHIAAPPGLEAEIVPLTGTGGTSWEQTTLARALSRDRPDLLFAPAYSAPLAVRCPVALAMHDVSFSSHPEWFGWREGARRRLLARLSARKARVVLTGSRFSRDEILRYLGVPASRVQVIRYGLGMAAGASPGTARESSLALYVGTILNRRHVPALIAGFALAARQRPELRLEIVGVNRSHPRQDLASLVASHDVGQQVRLRDWVDDAELGALYARASVFAFLSEYEGFGLTPLEALAAGAVPVVLDTPVAREVLDDAAIRVAAPAAEAVARGLLDALDPATQARIAAARPGVLARYDWKTAADQTLAALEQAARR